MYDLVTGTWAVTGSLVTPRFHHSATSLPDGRVLVTGGADGEYGGGVLASSEVYDPATGIWLSTGPMSAARRNHTATPLRDGRVLVTGGTDASGMLQSSAEVYDPATGSWSPVADMTFARTSHSATLLADGRVLVVGGGGSTWDSSVFAELFDPATNTWAPTGNLTNPRRYHSATLLPTGQVLVAGGFHEYTGIQTSAEAYDPTTGVWLPVGRMDMDRYLHTATLLTSGRVLVAGGVSNKDQSSAELFFPYMDGPMVRLRPNARVLGSQARIHLQSFDPVTGTLTFQAGMTNYQVGDIIVGEPTPNAPYGIPPVRVIARTETGGLTVYETVASSLEEVLEEGEVDIERELTAEDLVEVDENGNPVSETQGASKAKLCSVSGLGIKCSFNVPDSDSPVKLTGSLEFKAKQQFSLKFRKVLRIKEFKVAVGVVEKASLTLEQRRSEELFNFEVPLNRWLIKRWVVFIGPIPVTIEMYVKFKVGADGKVKLATEYSINQSASVFYGFRYTHDRGWEDINEKTFDYGIKEPSTNGLSVNGEVRGYVAAVPGVGIYAPAKLVGAESDIGSIKGYGKLKVQYPASPLWRFSAGLEFCAGLNLTLKLNLRFIKRDFDFKVISEGKCKDLELWHKEGGSVDANLALRAPVTASSSTYNPSAGWILTNVNDGQRDSVLGGSLGWSSGVSSVPDKVEWLQFDLGSSAILTKVDLYPRNDKTYGTLVGDGFPVDFAIDVSNDGISWQTVVWRAGYLAPSEVQSFPVSVPSARYVRIQATKLDSVAGGPYYMQLAEVEIYGRR
ncbi:MAG TPA: kelch repeat-containing protein [Archangium sp.]|nr:kelch repeat-containing protein [Archangium sp.]HYO58693.1 kelch repeat-containing protein [Archangium sp.]